MRWEFGLLILGGYIKEILEVIYSTIYANGKIYESLGISANKGIIITKCGIGLLFSYYFTYKYGNNKRFLCYILSFLSWACLKPIIESWGHRSAIGVLILLYPITMILIFLYIDRENVDSLKYILYERKDLIFEKDTRRIMKKGGSKVAVKKLNYLIIGGVSIVLVELVAQRIVEYIQRAIQGSGPNIKTKGDNQQSIETMLRANIESAIYVAISSILLAPIIEEFLFRKCIMSLNGFGGDSVFLSAFTFALMHLKENESVSLIIPYLVPALVFSSVMKLKKNIGYTISAHTIHNIVAFIFLLVQTARS